MLKSSFKRLIFQWQSDCTMQTQTTNYKRQLLTMLGVIGNSVRQRKAVRFDLNLPVVVRWNDRLSNKRERLGHTRDVSTSDLFVLCAAPPLVGTIVELEVRVPSLHAYPFEVLVMQGKGRVVRIGGTGEGSGFAATTTSNFVLHEPRA
jgi:hypothetical protein